MLVFEERGKPEFPEKNLSEQSREPTNSAHIWRRVRESNPGHIGGRRALSPLRQPCSPKEMCGNNSRYYGIAVVPGFIVSSLVTTDNLDVLNDIIIFLVWMFTRLHTVFTYILWLCIIDSNCALQIKRNWVLVYCSSKRYMYYPQGVITLSCWGGLRIAIRRELCRLESWGQVTVR